MYQKKDNMRTRVLQSECYRQREGGGGPSNVYTCKCKKKKKKDVAVLANQSAAFYTPN
jgi:hypothetical protein